MFVNIPVVAFTCVVLRLPVVVLPVTASDVNVPIDVIFGCAAVTAVPTTLVKVPCVPETLPAATLPVTDKLVNVPVLVI